MEQETNANCNQRSLLVAFYRKGSLLAAIKEHDSEWSLLVALCSKGSLLDMIKLLLVAIKAVRTVGSRPWLGHLQGWLATTKPPTGVASHTLATCKEAADCGQGPLQRGDRLWPRPPARGWLDAAKASPGQLPAASPQGAAPTARAAASKGSGADRRSSYRQASSAAAYVGVAAMAQRGQEGLGQSFCEKDDPTPLNSKNTEEYPRV
ncbi:hypothetical protein BHE74_00041978 [Ensete ventricosum]|nr:hypothetical protein BHE74_00041978 [Ensete ventricosum]